MGIPPVILKLKSYRTIHNMTKNTYEYDIILGKLFLHCKNFQETEAYSKKYYGPEILETHFTSSIAIYTSHFSYWRSVVNVNTK
jgi:hypothetical protein